MRSKGLKRAAFWAAALFLLALLLYTALEINHSHVHGGFTGECSVCQHLQTTGKAFGGALRAMTAVPFALALLQAGMFLLVAVALLRETPTRLKVKQNE